ncbi:AI-2E family transporter [Teichococcus aestuarii]|uniref:AI-2E family transporter n=1 Tax=Teichococcus aestuarii TaxID=568898 RepID=UPI00360F0EB5
MPDIRISDAAPSAKVAPAEAPDIRSLTTLAGAVVVVAGLYLGRDVLIPVTLAILLSLVLSPLVRLLRRAGLGRVGSVILAVLVAIGVLVAAGIVIGAQLAELAQSLPLYQHSLQQKIDTLRQMTVGRLGEVLERIGGEATRTAPPSCRPSPRRGHGTAAGAGRGAGTCPHAGPDGDQPALAPGRAAGADRHRPGGHGVHPGAAGRPARPVDPPVRLHRSAPHHRGDG